MALIAIPNVFFTGQVLESAKLNADILAIYNDHNGGIDDSNVKLGANINGNKLLPGSIGSTQLADLGIINSKMNYQSVQVVQFGPNMSASGNGKRMVTGTKAIGFSGGNCSGTIVFATDSDEGNPNFSGNVRVFVTVRRLSGTNSYYSFPTNVTNASFVFGANSSVGADATTQQLDWIAIGDA